MRTTVALLAALGCAGVADAKERVLLPHESHAFVRTLKDQGYREAMARADVEFRLLRGRTPTDDVTVVLVEPEDQARTPQLLDRLIDLIIPRLHATTFTKSSGYVVFTRWAGPNDGTWEGNVYGRNTTRGAYASINAQYHVATGKWTPTKVWTAGAGSSFARPRTSGACCPTSWHGGKCGDATAREKHMVDHTFRNAAIACTASAWACIVSGTYVPCLGLGCGSAIATSFVNELFAFNDECTRPCTWQLTSAGVTECK